MMREIVIYTNYGGFGCGITKEMFDLYELRSGSPMNYDCDNYDVLRFDPLFIDIVKTIKPRDLAVVSVPADIEVEIGEYDGWEWVAEKHRVWGSPDSYCGDVNKKCLDPDARHVVVYEAFGAFGLSDVAHNKLCALKGVPVETEFCYDVWDVEDPNFVARDDPDLVSVVISSRPKHLAVVHIPLDAQWEIAEYDGFEYVEEPHRRWN